MLLPIKLSEENKAPSSVQLLRAGEFLAEGDGKIKITPTMLASFKKNFDERVRGYGDGKLPIDYFHENEKVAAGWIESVELQEGGTELWVDVKWTARASQALSDGELRYISAEFNFDYKDNESGKKFGPTLFGAGLTNRPFIKGMNPIVAFSEEKKMTLDEAMKKIDDMEKENNELSDKLKKLEEQKSADAKKLSEEKAENDKKDSFNKMLSEGKAVEAQREPFMKSDMVKFAELAKPLNLNEKGTETAKDKETLSAQDEVLKLAEAFSKENKVTLSEGISAILKANKDLNTKYNKEVSI